MAESTSLLRTHTPKGYRGFKSLSFRICGFGSKWTEAFFWQQTMFLFLLLFFPFLLSSSIVKVNDFQTLKAAVGDPVESDLIVFDVDCILIIPKDKILRPCGTAYFVEQFTTFCKSASSEQLHLLLSKILLGRSLELVNAEIPAWITSLQAKSKTIAITTMTTGRLGSISNVEEWRKRELAHFGFDFSKTFPRYSHIVFGDLMKEGALPIYKDGILYTAKNPKEILLEAFLRRIKWQPQRLVFIDDELKHLEAVNAAFEGTGMTCVCVHYGQVASLPEELDKEVARQQFIHLCNDGAWLSDADIKKATIAP